MNPLSKRLFDIFFSALGLVALFLPFVAVAIIVKITSPGPVLYRQKRIGRWGKEFTIIKFRTMRPGAERGGTITTAGDLRITTIGRFLRRFKLDEFPQLWNVLIGRMSLVGPRPDMPGYADKLQGADRGILELRPGITGPASLYFRNEEELLATQANPREYNDTVIWPAKVALNRAYLENWSFRRDIGYILITVVPVLNKWVTLVEELKS
jgi:lipopolysaccharide/colanic/teichoic acid biosynthesis glycosyltransferase